MTKLRLNKLPIVCVPLNFDLSYVWNCHFSVIRSWDWKSQIEGFNWSLRVLVNIKEYKIDRYKLYCSTAILVEKNIYILHSHKIWATLLGSLCSHHYTTVAFAFPSLPTLLDFRLTRKKFLKVTCFRTKQSVAQKNSASIGPPRCESTHCINHILLRVYFCLHLANGVMFWFVIDRRTRRVSWAAEGRLTSGSAKASGGRRGGGWACKILHD